PPGGTITNDVRNTPPTDRERSLQATVADTIAPVAELPTKPPHGDARDTLGPGPGGPVSSLRRPTKISLEWLPLLHPRYNPGIAFVAGLRYGYSTLVLVFRGVLKSDFVAGGGATNKSQRVNMRIAALITHARAGGIYDFPARGTSGRLNPQLPLPIPSFAASACEQAFSR